MPVHYNLENHYVVFLGNTDVASKLHSFAIRIRKEVTKRFVKTGGKSVIKKFSISDFLSDLRRNVSGRIPISRLLLAVV